MFHSAAETLAVVRALLCGILFAIGAGASDGYAQSGRVDVLDPHSLPLGDGKVSSQPKRGYVYSCQTQFRGGGAQHAGDWIHESTWDATSKITVQGDLSWPNATFTIAVANGERHVTGNGLPISHTTGIFPVQRGDPAFQIDRNPNAISAQQIAFALPLSPALSALPSCVPMGMIGVALNGVAIFNALDAGGRDAVAHEVQDHCNGHPEMRGQYHYHGPSACIPGASARSKLIGYALDGFGIYSTYDENGRELTNADLDECHGRVSRIMWDGKQVTLYHYVLTREYPYTVGCFRGNVLRMQMRGASLPEGGPRRMPQTGPEEGPQGGPAGGPRHPPAEASAACAGSTSGAQCRFTSPR
jgi:YHYH protein